MGARHHFPVDHLGRSVSVTVRTGHAPAAEVLVDGKETGRATGQDDRPVTVTIELPTDPPTPVTVRATPGPGVPRCLLLGAADEEPQVRAPRPY
ncbi:hypothetical protein GCM10010275_11600 [Streptomyces litmocidini]|uniref:hypothetical protein n=1 Tax=Streptomyces litmocidini TaxID=67318 RepID=UPI00167D48ED|nr:hypothetical protein [Streptomyces litmocidini]GGU78529.1 hypothetical protein GCM10010275_11600 [Streptomyces litmocidini]